MPFPGSTTPNIDFTGILVAADALMQHVAQTTESLFDRIGQELGDPQSGNSLHSIQRLLQDLSAHTAQDSVLPEIAALELFTFAPGPSR